MDIAIKPKVIDFVREYEIKKDSLKKALEVFEEAGEQIQYAATVGGTYGETRLDTGRIHIQDMLKSLNISAWRHTYKFLNIGSVASAKDKKNLEVQIASAPDFTLENVKSTFRYYVLSPRENILRGLAEVFCGLDPVFKSHEKMKIGVKGLPKRVIIRNLNSYWGYGKEQLQDVINAIALYEDKPQITTLELDTLLEDENALLKPFTRERYNYTTKEDELTTYPARGIRLKRYMNGNGHLYFEPKTLKNVNQALAEYYGDVLADCSEERKPNDPQESTELAKDLQYYPTPQDVVNKVLNNTHIREGESILEPSCGCGRFLDAIKELEVKTNTLGIECNLERANITKQKGHKVLIANFLKVDPFAQFDHVIMNPPFYGKHYAKHVKHALKFLKKGGTLTAILPITARYDHKLLDGHWLDLPVGSFKESGTNINTCILTIRKGD